MAVKYNDYGELTMAGTSLKTLAQSFGTLLLFMMKMKSAIKCVDITQLFKSGLKYNISYASESIYMYPNGQISTRRRLTIRCSF